jgi:hypothetical protein
MARAEVFEFELGGDGCMAEEKLRGYQCCFCAESIERDAKDRMELVLLIPGKESSQQLWAHAECVQRVMHPSIPLLLPDDVDYLER